MKWNNAKIFQEVFIYILYAVIVLAYPIWHIFSYQRPFKMWDIVQFFIDIGGCLLAVSFVVCVIIGTYLSVTGKDKKARNASVMIAAFFIFPTLFVFLLKTCDNQEHPVSPVYSSENIPEENVVYICTGPQSRAYHMIPDCKGLDRCSREVIEVDVRDAIERGRHGCSLCCD